MEFPKVTEWIKLKPRYLFAIAFSCGALLFIPADMLESLGLHAFAQSNETVIGAIFLGSGVLLITHVLATIGKPLLEMALDTILQGQRQKRLHDLTSEEKKILLKYIENDARSLQLPITSGVVNGLVSEDIIYRSSSVGEGAGMRFAHNIQPWAREYLKENPELLE